MIVKHENAHSIYFKRALELAEQGRGFCSPNPAVGCVIVKDNHIIAEGFHFGAGNPHAEINALAKISNGKDTKMYITLEPCGHWGRTPPCTQQIIEKGVGTVYYGFMDSNPIVAGKGIEQLRNAGIHCEYISIPEIQAFYQSYQFWRQHNRPFVTGKIALTLDGKIAQSDGRPMKITSEQANFFTHLQRKRADAIFTTAQTIIADDPQLNVRLYSQQLDQNIAKPLYIIDSHLRTPPTATIFKTAKSITFFHGAKSIEARKKEILSFPHVRIFKVAEDHHGLVLSEILELIGKDGIHDLWLEVGGKCFQAFLESELLQRAYLYKSLIWAGEGQAAFTNPQLFKKVASINWRSAEQDVICELNWLNEDYL